MRPMVWVLGVVVLALALFGVMEMLNSPAAIPYGNFLDQLDAGNVASVTFKGMQIDGHYKQPIGQTTANGTAPQTVFRSQVPDFGDPGLMPELRKERVSIDVVSSSSWTHLLSSLPWPMVLMIAAVLIAGLVRFMRSGKTTAGSAMSTHPMMGLIAGLFGKRDQEPTRPVSKTPPTA